LLHTYFFAFAVIKIVVVVTVLS